MLRQILALAVVLPFVAAGVAACGADDNPGTIPQDGTTDTGVDTSTYDTGTDGDAGDTGWDPGDAPTDTIYDPPLDTTVVDTDRDGLPDDYETSIGTDPYSPDSDGDGVGDGVEVLAGTDPLSSASTIPPTDFYVVLPFEDPTQWRELEFTARLGKGDVFFLVDTTASMMTSINNVRTSLSGTIVPAISASIADAYMGVGDYRDFPNGVYGEAGDWTFALRQTMTADVPAVQTALNDLHAGGGADEPESMLEGLYSAVTGGSCGGSGFGQACFRYGSHPIVVVVTDANSHNSTSGSYDYDSSVSARSWTETMAALNSQDVKIVGAAVKVLAFVPAASLPDLTRAAQDTNSYDSSGSPTVYSVTGGSVSTVVVDGITDLVAAETQDVSARSVDDPADFVDATLFIKEIRPVWASEATSFDLTTFYGVAGGTTVRFSLAFLNDFLPHQYFVQIFRAQIVVHDVPGMLPLDVRNVYIVVPAIGGVLI